MRFPMSWLSEWVDIPEKLEPIQNALIQAGVEIEAVEESGSLPDKVVVGEVLKKEPHPDADKLSLCQVNDGNGVRQVVCGASNFKQGDKVPLALPGAVMPGGFKIKKSKIRGVASEGMMCSQVELGAGSDEAGLWILPADSTPGSPVAELVSKKETVLTVETTANRPDHLCVQGLSREIAALTKSKLKNPLGSLKEEGPETSKSISVTIQDPEACKVYYARILRGVSIGPSPQWLSGRVEACGTRSINNVVDVTNYVLFEMGQPLHAFDLEKLEGGKIVVRPAEESETLETLDGQTRKLAKGDLVIADAKKAVALGGVMGGADSEIGLDSKDILLEAAVFSPAKVRRTSRRLGLVSESSYRFERGVDAHQTLAALDRAAELILKTAGGTCDKNALRAGELPKASPAIEVDAAFINGLLDGNWQAGEISDLLILRGHQVEVAGQTLKVTPPSYRPDVTRPADVGEEVAQMAGVDNLPSRPLPEATAARDDHVAWQSGQALRDLCVRLGLWEAGTFSYLDSNDAQKWGLSDVAVRMDNPLSEEQALLRPSLLPNLCASAVANLKNRASGAGLFEWGKVFERAEKGIAESYRLAFVLAGLKHDKTWNQPEAEWDFYDLKGLLEQLAEAGGAKIKETGAENPPAWLHPSQALSFRFGQAQGWLGTLHPALAKELGSRGRRLFVLEMADPGPGIVKGGGKFTEINRLPSVQRDLSCLLGDKEPASGLFEFFKKDPATKTATVSLKDVFEGDPLPQGKRSLTFSIDYPAGEKSLTDEEVNQRHQELVGRLTKALPVEVRQ